MEKASLQIPIHQVEMINLVGDLVGLKGEVIEPAKVLIFNIAANNVWSINLWECHQCVRDIVYVITVN